MSQKNGVEKTFVSRVDNSEKKDYINGISAMTGVENLTAVYEKADSSRISKVEPRRRLRPYIILDVFL